MKTHRKVFRKICHTWHRMPYYIDFVSIYMRDNIVDKIPQLAEPGGTECIIKMLLSLIEH